MNGIVTPPPTNPLAPGTVPGPDDLVVLGSYWPAISIAALRDAEKIGTDVPDARLRSAICNAVLDVARELAPWQAARRAESYHTLEDVPPRETVDGVSDYVLLWARAVQSVVAADIGERTLTQSSTAKGLDRAEPAMSQAERQQRNVRFAIRDFLGVGRISVELI